MANILYISYDGLTDALGQSQVIPYLLGLAEKGHKISVLSTEKEANYLQKKTQIQSILGGKIAWHHIVYTKKPPLLSTLKDINCLWKKAKELQKTNSFDIVHCRSYIAALIGLRMKKTFKTKFVFDMRGFWADERVDGKIWNLKNPIFNQVYNFFKRKEIDFLNQADATISLTNNAKSKILDWENISNQPINIEVIPCCVDIDRFDASKIEENQKNKLRNELGINENDFVISYLGSIGTWYMLEEMLDFFNRVLLQKPNAKFLFITSENPDYIYTEAKKRNIDKKYFVIQRADYTEVPLYLSLSSFALFFILPVFSKSASSPIKQGEIMSMGIPIICNSGVGDTDFVLNKYQCGVLVNQFNDREYDFAIAQMLEKKFDKTEIREAAKDFYALKKGIELYHNTYQKVLEK